jgi:hypothetical protein
MTVHPVTSVTGGPGRLMELLEAQAPYAWRLSWSVLVDDESQRLLVLLDEQLDAVVMPAGIGSLVLTDLRIAMLAGPVFASEGDWTFLAAPAGDQPVLATDLRQTRVRLLPRGGYVELPGAGAKQTWVLAPAVRPVLSPLSAVLATARRAVARHPAGRV